MESKLIDEVIANTSFVEEDRKVLEGMDEDILKKMIPTKPEPEVKPDPIPKPTANAESEGKEEGKEEEVKPITANEYIEAAPPEIREVLSDSLVVHAEKKGGLIESILANKKNKFSKEDLEGMAVSVLNSVASLAVDEKKVASYTGQAPVGNQGNEQEALAVPIMNFEKEKE